LFQGFSFNFNNLLCVILDRIIQKKFRNVFREELIIISANNTKCNRRTWMIIIWNNWNICECRCIGILVNVAISISFNILIEDNRLVPLTISKLSSYMSILWSYGIMFFCNNFTVYQKMLVKLNCIRCKVKRISVLIFLGRLIHTIKL